MIMDFVKDHKNLPPVLFLNLDNCGRENKGVSLMFRVSDWTVRCKDYFSKSKIPNDTRFNELKMFIRNASEASILAQCNPSN